MVGFDTVEEPTVSRFVVTGGGKVNHLICLCAELKT